MHELNYLEQVFLEILDFEIYVSDEEFEQYKSALHIFFQEPMEPDKVFAIRNIFDRMQMLYTECTNKGIDMLMLSLPLNMMHHQLNAYNLEHQRLQ